MDIRSASIYDNVPFSDTFAWAPPGHADETKTRTIRWVVTPETGTHEEYEVYQAAWLGVRVVLKNYYGMFLSRKLVSDSLLERCGAFIKQEIKRTHADADHRDYLANSLDLWNILTDVFDLGVRVLKIQSFPSATVYNDHGCSFSNFMASNHAFLIKDIERLNDLLALSRNLLVTRKAAQDVAASTTFDHQVLQVIDACIRVTARGYDGEQVNTTESKWANIIAAYKKLTMTALQWLYTFVCHNERRKLHLFNQLFGDFRVRDTSSPGESTIEKKLTEQLPLSLDSFDPNVFQEAPELKVMDEVIRCVQGYCQQTMRPTPEYPHDFPQKPYGDFLVSVLNSLKERQNVSSSEGAAPDFAALPTAYFRQIRGEAIPIEAVEVAGPEQAAQEILEAKEKVLSEFLYQMAETDRDISYDTRGTVDQHLSAHVAELPVQNKITYPSPPSQQPNTGQTIELEENEDRDAHARDDYNHDGDDEDEDGEREDEEDDDHVDDDDDDEDDDEDDDSEDEVGSASRGLLTDIPLVLGPNEIDALPMMIQASIRSTDLAETSDEVHVMQALRCYRMINESAGRNLLRELLIFIAAWDLQEHELYFRLMMSIMDTILSYGLMPFAFDSFSEDKDVVSPAQSILIKLLTQMFRRRQAETPIDLPEDGEDRRDDENDDLTSSARFNTPSPSKGHFPAPPGVETTIVRYIFTVFRTHIIPQTCALIYLQGQIRLGKVLPEDFPLNLWDMERVYEGVYQFLEFFAVLTESEVWKALLVREEIVFELITLLRELDMSIPKSDEVHPTVAASQSLAAESSLAHDNTIDSNLGVSTEDKAGAKPSAASLPSPPTSNPNPVERFLDHRSSPPLPMDVVEIDGAIFEPVSKNWPTNGAIPAPPSAIPPLPVNQQTTSAAVFGEGPPSETASALLENNIEPADFEWRNLKKLVVLVLSSLVWRSAKVQDQIRAHGGVEMILNCCNADGNNPYIKDHAVMCLRFLLEGSRENQMIVRELEEKRARAAGTGEGVTAGLAASKEREPAQM